MQHTLHTFDLPTGPKLLIVQVPNAVKALVEVYVRAGRRYVSIEKNEIAHLTEHLLFESNASYPTPFYFMLDLEKDGIDKNGNTGKHFCSYYMTGGIDKIEKIVDLLLVQMSQPLFLEKEILSQKAVIRNELARKQENDKNCLGYRYGQLVVPSHFIDMDQRIQSLDAITPDDIQAYYKKHYVRKNLRFLAAGDFTDADIEIIKNKINTLEKTMLLGEEQTIDKSPLADFCKIDISPSIQKQQVFFEFGWTFGEMTEKEDDALGCFLSMLFHGMGSRIHQKARQAGLTYSIGSFYTGSSPDYNEFGFSDQTLPEKALELFELVLKEITSIREGNFSDDEFERAKGFIYNHLKTRFQLPGNYLNWYGDDFLFDLPLLDIQKSLGDILLFSRETISEVAKKFLKNDNWTMVVRGQDTKEEDFRKIIEKYV